MGTSIEPVAPLNAVALKDRFKQRCPVGTIEFQNWRIRVHRAISWYKESNTCPQEFSEARFLFLWIALNSLYSRWDNQTNIPAKEASSRQDFLRRIANTQGRPTIGKLLNGHRGLVRKILENPYLSEVFWRDPTNSKTKGWAAEDGNHLTSHLNNGEFGRVLEQVLSRLYVLRGQIVHGASTSGSKLNKQTRQYSLMMLEEIVPVIIHLVIEYHREDDWPDLCYAPQNQNLTQTGTKAAAAVNPQGYGT